MSELDSAHPEHTSIVAQTRLQGVESCAACQGRPKIMSSHCHCQESSKGKLSARKSRILLHFIYSRDSAGVSEYLKCWLVGI